MSIGVSNSQLGNASQWQMSAGLDDKDRNLLKTIFSGAVSSGDKTSHGRGYMGLEKNGTGFASVKFMTHWYERGLLTDSKLMEGVAKAGEQGKKAFRASERLEDVLRQLARKVGVEANVAALIDDYRNRAAAGNKSLLSRKVVFQAAKMINEGASGIEGSSGIDVAGVETMSSFGRSTAVKNGAFTNSVQEYKFENSSVGDDGGGAGGLKDKWDSLEIIKGFFERCPKRGLFGTEGLAACEKQLGLESKDLIALLVEIKMSLGVERITKQKMSSILQRFHGPHVVPNKELVKMFLDALNSPVLNRRLQPPKQGTQDPYQDVKIDPEVGGWSVGSKRVKIHIKPGVKGGDLVEDCDTLLVQSDGWNSCWVLSLINSLMLTKSGRSYLKSVLLCKSTAGVRMTNLWSVATGKRSRFAIGGRVSADLPNELSTFLPDGSSLEQVFDHLAATDNYQGKGGHVPGSSYKAEQGALMLGLLKDTDANGQFQVQRETYRKNQKAGQKNAAALIERALSDAGVVVINDKGHYRSVVQVRQEASGPVLVVADSLSGKLQTVAMSALCKENDLPQVEFYVLPTVEAGVDKAREEVSKYVDDVDYGKVMKQLQDASEAPSVTKRVAAKLKRLATGEGNGVLRGKFVEFAKELGRTYQEQQFIHDFLTMNPADKGKTKDKVAAAFVDYLKHDAARRSLK